MENLRFVEIVALCDLNSPGRLLSKVQIEQDTHVGNILTNSYSRNGPTVVQPGSQLKMECFMRTMVSTVIA